ACQELNSEGIHPAHFDLRFVKPLDINMLHDVFARYSNIITIEDGCLQGGMGSAILEFMADHNYKANVVRLGIPDEFIEHGEQSELWAICGYDKNTIINEVKKLAISRTTKTIAS
ncbi:MAG: transketolase C-terminal domain-containing protein, partial [Methylococcales bacterium]|nr:transketolase C-terminal domain-containing protein [Methylococcales bacterium]